MFSRCHRRIRSLIFPLEPARGRLWGMPRDLQHSPGILDAADEPFGPARGPHQRRVHRPGWNTFFLAHALRYLTRKPLRCCMYRLPGSFSLRLSEQRPVLLLRGQRSSVVLLAYRHLRVLEQTPMRASRALLRVNRQPSVRRIGKPFELLQRLCATSKPRIR